MCWSKGCCYNNICRSSNCIFYHFALCNPCCFIAIKLALIIGDFFVLYIKTVTSAIMVTPITMKKKLKELISQYYEVVVQWELLCSGQPKFTPYSVVHRICWFNLKTTLLMSVHCADGASALIFSFIWLLLHLCCSFVLPLLKCFTFKSIFCGFSKINAL